MKILFDLTSLDDNFSGIERYASNIALEMIASHHEYEYILIFKNKIFYEFTFTQKLPNVTCHFITSKHRLYVFQFKLPLLLYKIKADAYLFLAFPAPLLFYSKKSVSAIHDISCWDCPETMKFLNNYYFRILYRKSALFDQKIVTVSSFSAKRIHDHLKVNKKRIQVIYNGISEKFTSSVNNVKLDWETIKTKYNLPEAYILSLCTLEPRKNLRLLLESYNELIQENKIDTDLVLAGRKGWKIDNLFKDLQPFVTKRIHITGFIDEEDLPSLYRQAACFVFPSIYEGFGLPPLEAAAAGTVVISSNAASLPEILGDSAIYFENKSRESLKEKMVEALTDIKTDSIYSRYAITEKYNWKHSAKLFENLIFQLNTRS